MSWVEAHGTGWRGGYRDPDGRTRHTGTFKTKRAAKAAGDDAEGKIRAGKWIDPTAGKVTFATYFETIWYPNRGGELNTRKTYLSHYRTVLGPRFGAKELRRILPSDVQAWVADMGREGVKPSTIKARVKALQTVLAAKKGASAMRDGLIERNPVEGVQLPTVVEDEPGVYTPAQVDQIIAAMDPWWRPIPLLAKETGLRWGELMGLTVASFELGFRTVTARRTIVETSKAESGNGTRFVWKDYPKGKRARTVGIRPAAARLVAELVAERELGPSDRLFSMPDPTLPADWHPPLTLIWTPKRTDVWDSGLPVSRAFYRTGVWIPAVQSIGLPYLKPHALRGSHISWLLAGGADLPTVMERAGHREFDTTRRYIGRMPDADQRALDALDKAMDQW
ncbi:tyrosine-type recombinase/integrase [Nocardioides bruguierae]|uniref:tyrosine-type recombinase/integrase n=1 Tax=Nocardioides bruguierae TaxID=2945102 RepID=UPI0020224E8C|nr:tyrosine-type recombinase/integrase [Nocardioides bruguierae]MCL8026019.1 tyrosine-type recombinase/integrase [Nocardioides bruguierae]